MTDQQFKLMYTQLPLDLRVRYFRIRRLELQLQEEREALQRVLGEQQQELANYAHVDLAPLATAQANRQCIRTKRKFQELFEAEPIYSPSDPRLSGTLHLQTK